jgi:hypothetical protein
MIEFTKYFNSDADDLPWKSYENKKRKRLSMYPDRKGEHEFTVNKIRLRCKLCYQYTSQPIKNYTFFSCNHKECGGI